MGKFFTDTEVEDILRDVEATINKAAKLSKAMPPPPSDDDDATDGAPAMAGGDDSAPPMGDDAAAPADDSTPPPSDSAPPADDGMGGDGSAEAPGDDDTAPPMDGDPGQDGQGEQALEGEGQGDGDELSDQELHQIYSSMQPDELERHYMVVRAILRDQYQKMEKSEQAKTEGNGDMKKDKKSELKKKVAEQEKTINELKKSQKEMEDSFSGAIKAIELIAKPTRKAVVSDVQVLAKSEEVKADSFSGLSKAELTAKLNEKVKDPSLTKSQRQQINSFILSKGEEGKQQMVEILGGKK